MGLVPGPADQASGVAAVGVGPLHEGISGARAFQDALAAVAVLNVGPVDVDGEKPPVGVGQDVALAAADLLARVVAFGPPF